MATDDQNIVSQPPLMIPIADKSGMISRAWAIWVRDLYRRTSYKGGNAIDDNKNEIDDSIIDIDATLAEVIEQVIINIENIAINAGGIDDNEESITVNSEEIIVNAQNTLNLEHRALGEARPPAYDETGTSYAARDLITYPADDPQKYYSARSAIPAPAGPFNSSEWNEKSISENLTILAARELLPTKAAMIQFIGVSVDGPVALANEFNIQSVTRNGTGTYDCVIAQETFYGFNVLNFANPSLSYSFTPPVATEAFHLEYLQTSTTTFTIKVFEWIQGIGNKIELVPYDPITIGDLVFVTILSDISSGDLPPP